jgi:tRNA(Arg) A34 adenosine deaminase TadA
MVLDCVMASKQIDQDLRFMAEALAEARAGEARGEVPVGAVVVREGKIIGRGHNCPISLCDPAAHAEIIALREAARNAGAYRIPGAEIYVTIEPCVMCVGAILNARLAAVKYGARDEKAGALGSVYDIGRDGRLNHRIEVRDGLMESECAALVRDFFQRRRAGTPPG